MIKWEQRFNIEFENMLGRRPYFYIFDKQTGRAQWWNNKWDRTFTRRIDAVRSIKMKLYWEQRKIEEMLLGKR